MAPSQFSPRQWSQAYPTGEPSTGTGPIEQGTLAELRDLGCLVLLGAAGSGKLEPSLAATGQEERSPRSAD